MGRAAKPTTAGKPTSVYFLLFCGLPGSGKSTISAYLKGKGWEIVSQDDLGTQKECVNVLEKALKKKKSVILDRCCVTPSDRKLWVQRARAVDPNVIIETIHIAISPELCKARAMKRTDHPTLATTSASDVIDSFCRGYKKPEKWEGPYNACHTISDNAQLKWVKERYAVPGQVSATSPPTGTGVWDDEKDMKKATASTTSKSRPGPRCEMLILRHAERTDRVLDYRGTLFFPENSDDCEITKDGRSQAKKSGEYLASTSSIPPISHIYSSPFTRCVQTACEVALQLSIPSIRIEPGLSEFFGARLFHTSPTLNTPSQVERYVNSKGLAVDYSTAPEEPQLPPYPETGKGAKNRVIDVADALRKRHADSKSILLVTHSHALVEISNSAKSGTVNPRPGYCGLTHIDQSGAGQLLTDVSHQTHVAGTTFVPPPSEIASIPAKGYFDRKWNWTVGPPTSQHEDPQPDNTIESNGTETDNQSSEVIQTLLDIPLETVTRMFAGFGRVLLQGTSDQRHQFHRQWSQRDPSLVQKITTGMEKGWFAHKQRSDNTLTIHTMRLTPSVDISVLLGEMCQSNADVIALYAIGGKYLLEFKKLLEDCNGSGLLPFRYIMNFAETGDRDVIGYLVRDTLSPMFDTTLLSAKTNSILVTILHEGLTAVICLADFCCPEDVMRAEAILAANKKSLGSNGPHISLVVSQEKIFSALGELKSNSKRPTEQPTSSLFCFGSLCEGVAISPKQTECDTSYRFTVPDVQIRQGDFSLMKFPRTRHLYGVGSVGRDDLLMSPDDAAPYHDNYVTIEEKIDGANLGISFDNSYQVVFQNRGKIIGPSSGTQWAKLEQWYDTHKAELFELLGDRYILFGEWMVARHSISYDALPDYFICFDIYDKRAGRFLGVIPRNNLLSKTSLHVIKPLSQKVHPSKSDVLSLLSSTSFYTKAKIEGIYLRIDTTDGMWLTQRAKIVNEEFLEGIEEGHWASRIMEKNTLAH
eukprot:TRINITY_DN3721_c0_g5_i1.p1 TRINITY_DN3721_c0_g5~~TRINITY_DN3721_c0_g5_i1.p1  ORF type:complete len:984 (+),score=154.50 TRINITY_DN3721_c0_g5_i1:77-3028(+)